MIIIINLTFRKIYGICADQDGKKAHVCIRMIVRASVGNHPVFQNRRAAAVLAAYDYLTLKTGILTQPFVPAAADKRQDHDEPVQGFLPCCLLFFFQFTQLLPRQTGSFLAVLIGAYLVYFLFSAAKKMKGDKTGIDMLRYRAGLGQEI